VFSKAQVPAMGGVELSGVACVSPTSCFAVGASGQQPQTHGGSPIVAEWNGKTWSVGQAMQRDDFTYFDDIACPTAATCFAVGLSEPYIGTNGPSTLIERHDHSGWSMVDSPSPGTFDGLRSIACPAKNRCVAIGSTVGAKYFAPLVETWDGSMWSVASTPTVTRDTRLADVGCATVSDCLAVGVQTVHGTQSTFALHWNGSTWTRTHTLDGPGSDSLSAVSCSTVTFCTAVGTVQGAAGSADDQVLIEHWNGRAWSLDTAPGSGPQVGDIEDVACVGAGRCVAVGSAAGHALIDVSDGRHWSVANAPADAGDALRGVECTRLEHCVAVGVLSLGPQDPGALVLTGRPPT
jgi:hypothetical protein